MSRDSLSSESEPGRRGKTLVIVLVASLVLIATLFVVAQRREPTPAAAQPASSSPSQPANRADPDSAQASDCEEEEPPAESFALASCDGDSASDKAAAPPDKPDK